MLKFYIWISDACMWHVFYKNGTNMYRNARFFQNVSLSCFQSENLSNFAVRAPKNLVVCLLWDFESTEHFVRVTIFGWWKLIFCRESHILSSGYDGGPYGGPYGGYNFLSCGNHFLLFKTISTNWNRHWN